MKLRNEGITRQQINDFIEKENKYGMHWCFYKIFMYMLLLLKNTVTDDMKTILDIAENVELDNGSEFISFWIHFIWIEKLNERL